MPSLFERVGRSLTRKKPEVITQGRDSKESGLSGFEPISPNEAKGYVSPEPRSPTKEKSQNAFTTFLRSKSPSRVDAPQRVVARAPLLSLHLPDASEGGTTVQEKLGIVFEHPPDPSFSDDVIAAKRLTTAETLVLVQKTSSVLVHRGLETPGIFKAFWYAQSAEKQRRLLVAFLQTLSGDSAATRDDVEPKPNPAVETFDAYLASASPHDIAEVLKWALRHFKLQGSSFGNSTDEYGWYKTFAESEKSAEYPPEAYSTILPPLLPSEHQQLLDTLFNFASSLACYAEINGVSGSRFTRLIGWWLLSERREPSQGLISFIQEWETAALGSVDESSGNPEYQSIWADIKRSATASTEPITVQPASPVDGSEAPIVSVNGVLTEGSISILAGSSGETTAPPSSRPPESIPTSPLYRPLSPGRSTNAPTSTNPTAPASPLDWDDFSGAGFSSLSEGTSLTFSDFGPPSPRQTSFTVGANTRSTKGSRSTRRRSVDFKQPLSAVTTDGAHGQPKEFPSTDASAIVHQTAEGVRALDETFIDDWAEILLDRTVASAWPAFALYELREPVAAPASEGGEMFIRWLAIETYVVVTPEAEPSAPSSPVKGNKVKRSSSVKSDKRARFGFFSSSTSLGGKEGKEEKKEKRKEHVRRGSEISAESAAAKGKDASKSQPDLVSPPEAIAEEPEPSTPIPTLPSESKEAPEALSKTDATEAETEATAERPTIERLTVPAAEGSRFIEGSSPGTLPDETADPVDTLDEGDVNKHAVEPAVVGAEALNQKVSDNGESVPVAEHNGGDYANDKADTKADTQPYPDDVPLASDDAAVPHVPEVNVTEHIETSLAQNEPQTSEQADVEAQEPEMKATVDETGAGGTAEVEAEAEAERERLEAQRIEQEQLEQERIAQETAKAEEQARLEAERLEQERIAHEAAEAEAEAKRLEEEARQKAEAEELERQRIAEEEQKAEEARLEAERLAAEAAETERLAEIARQEAQRAEEERLQAEAKRLEEEAAEQRRLEAEALEAKRIEEEKAQQAKLEAE
ncbi:hypothetical protein FRC19_008923, partial [Serendipita sp. 401]